MPLPPRQDKVLTALLTTPTIADAARTAHVDEKTVRRYLQEPTFQQAYSQGRRQLVEEGMGIAAQGILGAVAVLRLMINDAKTPASSRVRACVALVQIAMQHTVLEDLEQRIRDLERSLKAVEQSRGHTAEV